MNSLVILPDNPSALLAMGVQAIAMCEAGVGGNSYIINMDIGVRVIMHCRVVGLSGAVICQIINPCLDAGELDVRSITETRINIDQIRALDYFSEGKIWAALCEIDREFDDEKVPEFMPVPDYNQGQAEWIKSMQDIIVQLEANEIGEARADTIRAVGSSHFVQPWWLNREWNPDETNAFDCVRCGTSMNLSRDCEWDDDTDYNFCHNCAHELVKECMERLNVQEHLQREGRS